MVRDALLPLETTDQSSSRSFSVSLTVYFRFGIAEFKCLIFSYKGTKIFDICKIFA